MMAEKARQFFDNITLQNILKSKNPKEQKAFGRSVQNFDAALWEANAKDIVKKGTLAKFSQNSALMRLLEGTSGSTLVEASPYDRFWGIGLYEYDPRAKTRNSWLGQNLLGEILTEVRIEMFGK